MEILEISYCACDACKNMCRKVPCTPTPKDVRRLIDAGYKDKLEVRTPYDKVRGLYWAIVKPKRQEKYAPCIFFTNKGLCELHNAGLKPTEGKFAIHGRYDTGLFESVAFTWVSEEGIEIVKEMGADQEVIDLLTLYLNKRRGNYDFIVLD